MRTENEEAFQKISEATCPEDLFDLPDGSPEEQGKAVHATYRQLARIVAPDTNGNSPRSIEVFRRLRELSDQGIGAIQAGTYGQKSAATIQTKRHSYVIGEALPPVGVANCYRCLIDGTTQGTFSIAQTPTDNDLLQAEAKALHLLLAPDRTEAKGYASMLPQFVESFRYTEAGGIERQASVFETVSGYVSLQEIRQAYPAGVHPKDMAWIWRRLLDVLGYAHTRGMIHGAVLPTNVLVGIGDIHEVVLTHWQAVVLLENGCISYIPIIDPAFQNWYPPEVPAKQMPTPGTDILMAARCMIALLGGDPISGTLPPTMHPRLRGFLQSCLLLVPSQRPQNAWLLREEFTEMIDTLWGKREYRPLMMPQ